MTEFFEDYQWSKGKPKGLTPIEDPTGKAHFRLLDLESGVRLEQFDPDGKFLQLICCPQDTGISGSSWETSKDALHRVRRGKDGAVTSYEEYVWPGGVFAEGVYPDVKIFDVHGRLVWEHRSEQVSDTAWDIHVLDPLGKLQVVLHHTDVDGREPVTITEDWVE